MSHSDASPPSGSHAERLLDQANSDPEFETKLRAGYDGRHDVLDALWWAAHPHTSSPRGVADPAADLRQLQRAAFSRSAAESPGELHQAEHRLREAERMLADDAVRLEEAVASVEPTAPAIRDAFPDARPEDDSAPTEMQTRPRRKYLLPLISVAAVLAAIVAFPALSGLGADADSDPTPTTTSPIAERVRTEIVTLGSEGNVGDPLAILDRAQNPEDRPADVVLRFRPETYRALPGLVSHAQLYLARGNETDAVCFVVIREDEQGMSACQPESQFTGQHMSLGSGRYELTPELTILTESYSLFPNGDFSYAATARATGQEVLFGGSPVVGG